MKEHIIQELEKEKWKGTPLPVSYTTDVYYDISVRKTEDGFDIPIRKMPFETPYTHNPGNGNYPDRLYADWWEGARAFGIVEDGKLLAAIEVCPEEWSKRLMVTELFVSEELRGQGYGSRLLGLAKELTVKGGYRAMILDTHSSNVNAVDFYLHEGLELIGFDTCCYSNNDIRNKEVRIDMAWFPEEPAE